MIFTFFVCRIYNSRKCSRVSLNGMNISLYRAPTNLESEGKPGKIVVKKSHKTFFISPKSQRKSSNLF